VYKGAVTFSASEHSRIFLVSPEPRNDRVISWVNRG